MSLTAEQARQREYPEFRHLIAAASPDDGDMQAALTVFLAPAVAKEAAHRQAQETAAKTEDGATAA